MNTLIVFTVVPLSDNEKQLGFLTVILRTKLGKILHFCMLKLFDATLPLPTFMEEEKKPNWECLFPVGTHISIAKIVQVHF